MYKRQSENTSLTYVSSSSESEDADMETPERSSPPLQDELPSTALVPFHIDTSKEKDVDVDALCEQLVVRSDAEHSVGDDSMMDALTKMIDECAQRWSNSATVVPHHRPLAVVESAHVADERMESIIQHQRAEIDYLRSRLATSQGEKFPDPGLALPDFAESMMDLPDVQLAPVMVRQLPPPPPPPAPVAPPPVEQIDSVPIEQIEVAVDDTDLCSVTSGLTNLVDLSRLPDDGTVGSMPQDGPLPLLERRPDAEASTAGALSHANSSSAGHPSRVTEYPLHLRAADGSSRRALYTGPVQGGKFTGVGVLNFIETGDLYTGDIFNGEMHGHGTYTFARRKKKHPHKVLRGLFENNVYTGWNPDAVF